MLRRAGAVAAGTVLLVSAACGGPSGAAPRTITVGGDTVTAARLIDASVALCGARSAAAGADPTTARGLFYDRAHDALHTVARALEPLDRARAAQLLEAMQQVEAELETRPPALADDLGHLGDVYRSSLARLAIPAPPCVE